MRLRARHTALEPGASELPVAFDGASGDFAAQDFGDFDGGEAAEEFQLDDAGLAGVGLGEFIESVVEPDHVGVGAGGEAVEIDGGAFGVVAAALGGEALAGVVDEDAAHDAGGHADEVGAALPGHAVELADLQVGFVDERGGLERMAGALLMEDGGGEAPEVLVEQGGEFVEGVVVA